MIVRRGPASDRLPAGEPELGLVARRRRVGDARPPGRAGLAGAKPTSADEPVALGPGLVRGRALAAMPVALGRPRRGRAADRTDAPHDLVAVGVVGRGLRRQQLGERGDRGSVPVRRRGEVGRPGPGTSRSVTAASASTSREPVGAGLRRRLLLRCGRDRRTRRSSRRAVARVTTRASGGSRARQRGDPTTRCRIGSLAAAEGAAGALVARAPRRPPARQQQHQPHRSTTRRGSGPRRPTVQVIDMKAADLHTPVVTVVGDQPPTPDPARDRIEIGRVGSRNAAVVPMPRTSPLRRRTHLPGERRRSSECSSSSCSFARRCTEDASTSSRSSSSLTWALWCLKALALASLPAVDRGRTRPPRPS